jgi:hypothetical protein
LSQRALYAAARVSPTKRCLLRPHTDEQADKMLRDAWMAGLVKLPCSNWATHEQQQWAVHVWPSKPTNETDKPVRNRSYGQRPLAQCRSAANTF